MGQLRGAEVDRIAKGGGDRDHLEGRVGWLARGLGQASLMGPAWPASQARLDQPRDLVLSVLDSHSGSFQVLFELGSLPSGATSA